MLYEQLQRDVRDTSFVFTEYKVLYDAFVTCDTWNYAV